MIGIIAQSKKGSMKNEETQDPNNNIIPKINTEPTIEQCKKNNCKIAMFKDINLINKYLVKTLKIYLIDKYIFKTLI